MEGGARMGRPYEDVDEEVLDDSNVSDDDDGDYVSSSHRQPPRRSGSISSPPIPPPLYNPPADKVTSPTITPPSSAPSSTNSSSLSISQQLSGSSHDVSLAAAAAVAASRPRLEAIQRISSESVNSTGSPESTVSAASGASTLSAGSIGSPASDGEAHLIEAREMLMSGSGETSRRDSLSTERGNTTPPGRKGSAGPELNLITPTPPLEPVEAEDREEIPEAGPSKPRRSSSLSAGEDEGHDLPMEHAWDSVWPAPGSTHRHPYAVDATRPHFPTAPVSPFVTPAFSPAIIPTTAIPRRPPSPIHIPDPNSPLKRAHSPTMRSSPRDRAGSVNRSPVIGMPDDFSLARRRSITSPVPFLNHSPPTTAPVSINKHQRSFSASSPSYAQKSFHGNTLDRIQGTPPTSPPASPSKRPSGLGKSGASDPVRQSSPNLPPTTGKKSTTAPLTGHNRLADLSSASQRPVSSPNSQRRPRGKSLSSLPPFDPPSSAELDTRPDSPRPHAAHSPSGASAMASSSSLPPISLPPAVTPAPVMVPTGDDGLPLHNDALAFLSSPLPVVSPLFAPLSRPAMLRRAMSDYDPAGKNRSAPPLNRSISITAELDKSPKRHGASADIKAPTSPRIGADADVTRVRKSPRRSPRTLPAPTPTPIEGGLAEMPPLSSGTGVNPEDPAAISQLVDEGDVLPNIDFQMDVTFDDEGLNTLERIFLLSKSEFPFHRAYVARVLGDLLVEVDPCESVEYVLPLLSGFSMDEDESVKEAFASELHRILWYFYSTCKLVLEEDEIAGVEYKPMTETVTVTSQGVDVVPKSTAPEPAADPAYLVSRSASLSGPSTSGSATSSWNQSTHSSGAFESTLPDIDTPASTTSTVASSAETAFSPGEPINPFADDMDPEKGCALNAGPLVDRPILAIGFFTPLLGSLLLNPNPTISDSVRSGVVHIIGRLRGGVEPVPEVWGVGVSSTEVDERRIFASQNGPHSHDLRPFDRASRQMVEDELLAGIIVGMGQLSVDMPDTIDSESGDVDMDLFQEQLIAEASAGRATSMNLIGSLCEFYDAETVVKAGFVDEVLRSGDGDILVRAEGAVALSCLAKIAPVEKVYELIPLFELFLSDETEHVQQSACLALPAICKRIEDIAYRRDFAVNAVSILACAGDEVRCAMLEMLGEIIYVFVDDETGPPKELLDVYTEDVATLAGLDGDWDVVAAFNFPGVALTLGTKRWDELRPLYSRLQVRAGDKIMRILAASLHELAKILDPDQVASDLLPVYRRCITCNDEIRERVYEHVDVIISQVKPEVGWEVFQDLADSWRNGSLGGWRAREQLALHLPKCLEMFREVERGTKVLEVLRDALLDPFAAVRDGVTQGIPEAYAVLGDDSPVAIKFREMLLGLSTSPVYRRRLTFVRCLREFIRPPPNQHAFENFFVPSLPSLTKDVVDIRLGLAQAIADLFVVGAYYGKDTGHVPQEIKDLAQTLSHDSSLDVRDTLRNVKVDSLHKGKGIPYSVAPSHAPSRGVGPEEGVAQKRTDSSIGRSSHRPSPSQSTASGDASPTSDSSTSSGTVRGAPARRPSAEVSAKLDDMRLGGSTSRRESVQSGNGDGADDIEMMKGSPSPDTQRRASFDPFSASFSEAAPTQATEGDDTT